MALNDIYMLTHRQTWGVGGRPINNVYFFEHTAGAGVAIDLAQAFQSQYLPVIGALQSILIWSTFLEVINLGDLGDFVSYPVEANGSYGGDVLPPYAAYGFTQRVNTRAVRKGSKRIAGVPESAQANGVVTFPDILDAMEDFRILLESELTDVSDTWLPVVIKRVKTPVVGTVPLQYTYRLPTSDLELVVGEVVNVSTSPNLTHQVSRSL